MYVDPKLYAAEELANAIIIKAVEDYRKAMTRKYTFTTKDIEIIKKARKKNKDKRAEKGEIIEVSEIEQAYQKKIDHKISSGQIYLVLHRHGWRKIMPRSRHPKKAKALC